MSVRGFALPFFLFTIQQTTTTTTCRTFFILLFLSLRLFDSPEYSEQSVRITMHYARLMFGRFYWIRLLCFSFAYVLSYSRLRNSSLILFHDFRELTFLTLPIPFRNTLKYVNINNLQQSAFFILSLSRIRKIR